MKAVDVLHEAIWAGRAQPVASLLTILMVAGSILAVTLTTGRTVAAEQEILQSIDSAGTRSITIRAEESSGVTSDVLDRAANVGGIEWIGAFSAAVDATNSVVPDGIPVPVRTAYGTQFEAIGVPAVLPLPGQVAYASDESLHLLGLVQGSGTISLTSGRELAVVGGIEVPDFLAPLEPLNVVPEPHPDGSEPVVLIVITATRPDLVAPVSEAVLQVLAADDPSKVTVQTSENLARLRALVEGQLSTFSRGLVLALLSVTGGLIAIMQGGLVMMHRRDYGRRRALGATRGLIVSLLLIQSGALAIVGVAVGTVIAVGSLTVTGSPLPGVGFIAALAVLTVAVATLGALVPALFASRRDPVRELRVP
ncbi:ABC transporter permease [Microbacterium telephonicum]|uniref:ABC transporter permease n=1 Tax=Microbacterium telephonicum TaxID=1714841 RepID=UPI000EB30DDF|nr:FtsX-like permease family protein [Microbacterium telephonicum]